MAVPDETILEIDQQGELLQLTLNRPHSANALSPELTEALIQALTQTPGVRLCVIRAADDIFVQALIFLIWTA